MDPRESRYFLRIDSGARQGERVPVPEGGLTMGRRSANELTLVDGSVSGQHAEIRPDGGAYLLADLGSTNGTKVAGSRIEGHRLAHGDHFQLGNVELTFLDSSLESPVAAPAAAPAPGLAPAGDEVGRISAARVEASGRRGLLGGLLLVALVAAAAASWWFFGRSTEGTTAVRVPEVPGNLVAGGTFEALDDTSPFTSVEAAPQEFYVDGAFAATGAQGYGVDLEAGEWARVLSAPVPVGPRRAYALRASVQAEGGARGRVGVLFTSTSGSGPEFMVWSRVLEAADDFADVELQIAGLPGYERARVVLAATAPAAGSVSVDDVSLLEGDRAAGTVIEKDSSEARLFGDDATTAAFVRSGRVLLPGIDHAPWRGTDFSGWGAGSWTAAAEGRGFRFSCPEAPADASLELTLNVTERGEGAENVILAAIGPEGYRSLAGEFTVPAATDLLVGSGVDLVRIHTEEPIAVTGAVRDGALRFRLATGGRSAFHLQLSFVEERTRAKELATRAEEEERRGASGAALATWSTLLEEVPFDAALVARAEATRGRLVQSGMERVAEIRAEVERARFFGLAELFRQCRDSAVQVGRSYAGTEVEAEVSGLVGEIDGELSALAGTSPGAQTEALRLVLEAMKQDEAPDLTAHVIEALDGLEGSEAKD